MLRINLLPPYIYDKQQKIRLAIAWGIGVAAVVFAFIMWFSSLNTVLKDTVDKQQEAEAKEKTYKDYTSKIAGVDGKIAETKQKQTFVANAMKYDAAWPALLSMMRDLTSDRVILSNLSLEPNHKTLDMAGFSANEVDVVRWWMVLRNNTQKFDRVFFSLPPHPYTPGSVASAGGGAYAGMGGAYAGMGGSGGGMGGSGGGMGGSSGMPGGSPYGGASSGGSMGGSSAPATSSFSSMGGSGGGMMGGSGGMGQGQAGGAPAGAVGPGVLGTVRGITFVAAVDLKTPFAEGTPLPIWPSSAVAPSAARAGASRGTMPPAGGRAPGGRKNAASSD